MDAPGRPSSGSNHVQRPPPTLHSRSKREKDATYFQTTDMITNWVLVTICNDFTAVRPDINPVTWESIISPSSSYRDTFERMEFIGDAVLYLSVGREIYERYSYASPNLMTVRTIHLL
jgi:hypothetical protein